LILITRRPGLQSCFRPAVAALRVARFARLLAYLLAGSQAVAQIAPSPPETRLQQAQQQAQLRQQNRTARDLRFLSGRRVFAGSGPTRSAAQAASLARAQHAAMLVQRLTSPRASTLSAPWSAIGPIGVASGSFGDVSGRVTSLALDPADATGNTLYVGTTGGGVWKSTNAAGPAGSAVFTPLTDTLPVFSANAGTSALPSLSIGAVAMANGVLLAGTGDPNDATDSYYGSGILRSADSGATWTLTQQSLDGVAGNHSFFGLGVAGFAFSTANPSLVVAALSQAAEGTLVNAPDAINSVMGLYYSADAGLTWHMAVLQDGGQVVQTPLPVGGNNGGNAATAVVWNAVRQRFYAAVRFHGYYESLDGMIWTRLANQPGAGLTSAACPVNANRPGAAACPIFRGALAVQALSGDMFALTVSSALVDQGLYLDVCNTTGSGCASSTVLFGTQLASAALEVGAGSKVITQGDYNLALAAVPATTSTGAAQTLLFAGTVDLYRCAMNAGSAAPSCTLRNTTNSENGCLNPAGVAPAQHALATLALAAGPLVFTGNDGGLYRSTDGVSETGSACNATDALHFDNLNPALGSLAEVVSFAQDPVSASTLLAGLGALGSAGTGSDTPQWTQLSEGEGGTVAIDPATPANWYISTGAGVSIARCTQGSSCTAADFATPTIGAAQVANDIAAIHAPWLLDPAATGELVIGTCRAWRGPASSGTTWSTSNAISRPFGAASASACSGAFPVVRSLAAGGAVGSGTSSQNNGSEVLYAGLAGTLDGGQGLGGHLFATTNANIASNATPWSDTALAPVTNDLADSGVFNPGGFDISSVAADPHDATGRTVYASVMGFAGNGTNAPHLYRSLDAGAHWTNISSNLPNAPANSILVDPNDANTVYAALDTGVYVTTAVTGCTSTNCWSVLGTGLPNAPAIQLAASAAMPTGDGRVGELRVATYGRGIWAIPLLTAISPAAPAMTLNPVALTFATQQSGTVSAAQTVTVNNTGNAALTVSSITTTGNFIETDTCVGSPVPQGGSCTVQVSFEPAATGTLTGLLTVYGNVAGGQATASLTGTGTPAASIVLTPSSLSFPASTVGVQSAVENITVANTGGSTATLQTPAITGDFAITFNSCGAMLASQVSCTVSITFTPTVSGVRSGTFSIVDSAGTQVAGLIGTGTNPATDALTPTSLSFAAQQLGTSSAAQSVTLTNAGDVALTLISAQIASGDFAAVNACGNSLAPHSSCAIQITYIPKATGNETGTLTLADQYRTQIVMLSGFGLAPPGVSLSPTSGLSFGASGVGIATAAQTVTLTNNGGVTLSIAGIATSGDFALAPGSNTCSTTLAPAAVCTVGVIFTASAAGTRTGTIAFADNAGNSPQTLALTGTGVDFNFAPDGPTSITVTAGQPATFALLLSPAAGVPGSATFTCSGFPAHSTCTVNPTSVSLGSTSVVTVTVATSVYGVSLRPPAMPWNDPVRSPSPWFALLFAVPMFAVGGKRLRPIGLLAVIALAAVLLGSSGCSTGRLVPSSGSTSSGPVATPTPTGAYTLLVTASSAGLSRSVNLTLTVQ
jgi:hypothetical protein